MASQSLNPIVDVVVQVSPLAAPRRAFDTGLIIGASEVIPSSTAFRLYENTDAMLEDGFTAEMPEYQAASLYFSQSPRPRRLLIGNRNINGIDEYEIDNAGSGYAVGNIVSVVGGGGTGATFTVTEIGEDGAVTELEQLNPGRGYSAVASAQTTVTPAGGTGLTIDITELGLASFRDAVSACRQAEAEWYAVACVNATKAEILQVAEYIETATPTSVQFYTTDDADIPGAGEGNIFAALKALKRKRSLGQYSTTNPYAAVSIMAYAMRNNTGLANSTYTLKFKQEPGVTVEPVSSTELLNIKGNNGNIYINRGVYYDMFEEGVMADGSFFDEIINLDMLANNIQLNVMDVLYRSKKVPQTEAGVTQLVNACNQACVSAVNQGFLAPGVWTGEPVLDLNTGDLLPLGYMVQSEPISSQSQADREARKAPPIYVSIKEAGSIHSVTIGVYVNR